MHGNMNVKKPVIQRHKVFSNNNNNNKNYIYGIKFIMSVDECLCAHIYCIPGCTNFIFKISKLRRNLFLCMIYVMHSIICKFTKIILTYLTYIGMDITFHGFLSSSRASVTFSSRTLILAVS
jgi:hypothetical protein